jgi:hypothetical protein
MMEVEKAKSTPVEVKVPSLYRRVLNFPKCSIEIKYGDDINPDKKWNEVQTTESVAKMIEYLATLVRLHTPAKSEELLASIVNERE